MLERLDRFYDPSWKASTSLGVDGDAKGVGGALEVGGRGNWDSYVKYDPI